jgi:hypothetical protein
MTRKGINTNCSTLALLPALQAIVSSELAGLEPVAQQLLAANVPYVASVQLNPPLGYDPDKVKLLLSSANWTRGPGGVWWSGTGQQPLVGSCMLLAVPLLMFFSAATAAVAACVRVHAWYHAWLIGGQVADSMTRNYCHDYA